MPRYSERKKLLQQLNRALKYLILYGEEESEDFQELLEIIAILPQTRNLNPRNVVPKSDGIISIFWDFPASEFRQLVRCDHVSFIRIAAKIGRHPIFQNNSNTPQEKVWIQLFVALNRLGCDGNGASLGRVARLSGIGHGTVHLYTSRVITALMSFKDELVRWPNAQQRRKIARRFATKHGLFDSVGIVDGTPIVFAQRPHIDGEVYYDRKRRYSIKLQLICDDRRRIIFYQVGWPGSVFDMTVLGESVLARNPEECDRSIFLRTNSSLLMLATLCVGGYAHRIKIQQPN